MPSSVPLTLPLLLGSLFSYTFFGALLVQVYIYQTAFTRDPPILKLLVYFLSCAITVDAYLNASDIVFWFATSYGNPTVFSGGRYSKFYGPIMSSFIPMVVQLCFCYRIFILRRTVWPLCILIALISLAQFVAGFCSGVLVFLDATYNISSLHERFNTVATYVWLTSGTAADVLIAITMTVLLSAGRSKGHHTTHNIAKSLTILILETNTFSAMSALAFLVLFTSLPGTLYILIPGFALSAIYANTLLVTLNNRVILRSGADAEHMYSTSGENPLVDHGDTRFRSIETVTEMSFATPTAGGHEAAAEEPIFSNGDVSRV
ncbi:hypothetical protein R3P38DRAFT_3171394 [Favolaschia claudopus]|uniref:DUF6534 domain-containing protein n=1 Tax=Favolaschia claudopus TaxID=2862362 RepID=A0AAW0DMH6_9AGAR